MKAAGGDRSTGLRLPAGEIDALVVGEVGRLFTDPPPLAGWIAAAGAGRAH